MLSDVQKLRVLGYKIRRVNVRGNYETYDWVNHSLGYESDNTYENAPLAVEDALKHSQEDDIGWDACPIGDYDTGITVDVLDDDVLGGE